MYKKQILLPALLFSMLFSLLLCAPVDTGFVEEDLDYTASARLNDTLAAALIDKYLLADSMEIKCYAKNDSVYYFTAIIWMANNFKYDHKMFKKTRYLFDQAVKKTFLLRSVRGKVNLLYIKKSNIRAEWPYPFSI